MSAFTDPFSIGGKTPEIAEHAAVLVIGAGEAGMAAAIEAARSGAQTVLIDEHPLDSALFGLDVPFHFGQRADGSVQNQGRALDQIAQSHPRLDEAFEAGVDVRLGVTAWAGFVNGPTAHGLPKPVVALADVNRSWLTSFDKLIVAAGRRDLGFAFPGWELPGVMGAAALHALTHHYRAFAGRRILVLGGGRLGFETALDAKHSGIDVVAIVEAAPVFSAPNDVIEAVKAAGIALHASSMIARAEGSAAGVERVEIVALDATLAPIAGSGRMIDCDTICLALGAVPNIELLDQLGCKLTYRENQGGHVPLLSADGQTSLEGIFAIGDCAGIASEEDGSRRLQSWTRAALAAGGLDVTVCQCEEVTRRDLLDVRPPRYLDREGAGLRARSLQTLLADGPVNQDQIKRLTRAGMGACQGRRCREQVTALLALAGGIEPGAVPLPSYRPPLRPLPLSVLRDGHEHPGMRSGWDVWFGIEGQFDPYWTIK
ncbi:NAD(P)/FAD-dependent oxidoreductase [Hypericibacter sp.]|uniref:FAD/NAD(P)-dependent oxidoreductase n=1 Tax=Hypericibacter sp. TaxID=2705401 RepID=UPI003D6CAF0C